MKLKPIYGIILLLVIGCTKVIDELEEADGNPFDPNSSNYGEMEYISQFAISKGSLDPTFIVVSGDGKLYVSWGGEKIGGEGSTFIAKYDSDGELLKEIEIRTPFDQSAKIEGFYLGDNELYVVGHFNEFDENGVRIRVQKYSLNLQLVSKIGIPNLLGEEYGFNYIQSAQLISVGPNGNYYVTYANALVFQTDPDFLRLFVRVYDTNGNLTREFGVDTTGIPINGDILPIVGITINRADEQYYKLSWFPPLGGNAIKYTIKYSSQNTRVKHWEFDWTGTGVFDRLTFTKEGYISVLSGDRLTIYDDEDILQEISFSNYDFRFRALVAFDKTEKIMYAITDPTQSSGIVVNSYIQKYKYYW